MSDNLCIMFLIWKMYTIFEWNDIFSENLFSAKSTVWKNFWGKMENEKKNMIFIENIELIKTKCIYSIWNYILKMRNIYKLIKIIYIYNLNNYSNHYNFNIYKKSYIYICIILCWNINYSYFLLFLFLSLKK